MTKNHGTTWVDRSLPNGADVFVSSLAIDPRNRDTMYATRNTNDGLPTIWKTTNAGQTWVQWIGTGTTALPANLPVWTLTVDPRDGTLYAGTDKGVYVAALGSNSWRPMNTGLPIVQVRELTLNPANNTLAAATYGRGVYQLFLNEESNRAGGIRVTSGSAVWTGDIVLTGDTSIGADGSLSLPGVTNARLQDHRRDPRRRRGQLPVQDRRRHGHLLRGEHVRRGDHRL